MKKKFFYPGINKIALFKHMTQPEEKKLWDQKELREFEINLDEVDRIYHVRGNYFLMARMKYKNRHIFVEFHAFYDLVPRYSIILITIDPNLFRGDRRLYQSLKDEGYCLQQLSYTAPMLKFLCHFFIYENKHNYQQQQLPLVLKNSIDEFIQVRELIYDYKNYDEGNGFARSPYFIFYDEICERFRLFHDNEEKRLAEG